jgi:Short C-terminal domain
LSTLTTACASVITVLSSRRQGAAQKVIGGDSWSCARHTRLGVRSAALRGKAQGKIRKIERLQKLRESGALTDAEFQREKAKILSEG